MTRMRLVFLSLLAILAVGAIGAAAAAAAPPHWYGCVKQTGGKYISGKCETAESPGGWERIKLKEGERLNYISNDGKFNITAYAGGFKTGRVEIRCSEELGKGWIENPTGGGAGQGKTEMALTGCNAFGESGELLSCVVKEGVVFNADTELLSVEGKIEDRYKPVSGVTLLGSITLEGCPGSLNGTHPVYEQYTGVLSESGFQFFYDEPAELNIFGKSAEIEGLLRDELESGGRLWAQIPEPIAITEAASKIMRAEAKLNGAIDPEGLETRYEFEYGTTTSYGHKTSLANAGSGTSSVKVSQTISGLTAGTEYHYRVVAQAGSDRVYGADGMFRTLTTTASTGSASKVVQTKATLEGTVNPGEVETSYHFEYGPTTAYGHSAPVPSQGLGHGSENVPVAYVINGLSAGSEYHFRVVATSGTETILGADHTFTTPASLHWFGCTKTVGGKYKNNECGSEGVPNEWEWIKLKEGEKVNFRSSATAIVLGGTLSGIKLEVKCEKLNEAGWLENPTDGEDGVGSTNVSLSGCTLTKPAGSGCSVNTTIELAAATELLTVEGKYEARFTPSVGGKFASVTISGCTAGYEINGTYSIEGEYYGVLNNTSSSLEFSKASTVGLTLGGNSASLTGTTQLQLESGGGHIKGA